MKKLFLILTILFLSGKNVYSQINDTNKFIHELFSSFQTQDEKRFVNLYPNANQLKTVLYDIMKRQAGADTSGMHMGKAMLDEINDSALYNDYAREYRKAMDSARVAGVIWADARFAFSQADTSKAEDIDGKMLRGMIYFTSGQKDYFISFYEVLWPKVLDGWVGASIRNIGITKHPDDE